MPSLRYCVMTEEYASLIAGWTYEEPYSVYNIDDSEESISELMNGDYYYVLNSENELVGFICTRDSARVAGGYAIGIYNNDKYIDLGLGLNPSLVGKGTGVDFLTRSIQFVRKEYHTSHIQLVVARFNERVIKVYERVGFVKGPLFQSKVGDQEIDFIVMNYSEEPVKDKFLK
jgi:[ribosomal protein S18]-alanine N-acetyltransferase